MEIKRIRQVCLIAHDLDRVQQQFSSVFGVEVCHRWPESHLGLRNCLIPFGNQFMEIVSPVPGVHGSTGERFLSRRGGDSMRLLHAGHDPLGHRFAE